MKRLFTFGCSFTRYDWPTWADILGKDFDHYENWGENGAGNHFIFNSIIEANLKKNFKPDDTICVMWTNVTREDRYLDNVGWQLPGNLLNTWLYDNDFIKKYFSLRGCYIRDFAYIDAIKQILDSIGCRYYFLSMVNLNNADQYETKSYTDEIHDLEVGYRDALSAIRPSVHDVIFNYNWESRPFLPTAKSQRIDHHPTPAEHLAYLTAVLPEISISDKTQQWVHSIDKLLRQRQSYDHLWEDLNGVTRQDRW